MSIETEAELAALQEAGRIVRLVIAEMRAAVRAGVTTVELDRIGGEVMREHGARSAPRLVYGFPGENCISVNDEVVHGVPSNRLLADGDLVKLDVTVEKNGFMADACVTVPVGRVSAGPPRSPRPPSVRSTRHCARCAPAAVRAMSAPRSRSS